MIALPLSKERIVACAADIVRAEGSHALGLRRVARALGVTAPALYGYVDSLDGLMRALAETQFEELERRFSRLRARTPENRVRGFSRIYIDYAREEPELFKLLFRFPPDLVGSGVENELPIATKVFMAAAEPLSEGRELGDFPNIDPLRSSLAVWASVHGCATAVCMGFDFDDETVEQLIDDVLDMIVAGLRA